MTDQRISFQLTLADYVHGNRYHCWRRALTPRALVTRLVVAVAAFALGSLIGWALAGGGPVLGFFAALAANWVNFLGGLVLFMVGLPLAQQVFIPWHVRRFYAQQKSARLPVDMSWNREGIIFETGNSRIVIPFGNIHYWRESGQAILLYQNDVIPNFVMKRCFASQDQLASFRAELTSNNIPRR